MYSAISDLPNASTYHGAIAHVHAEGAMYFAHSGNWVKLANNADIGSGGVTSLSGLSDTTIANLQQYQVAQWSGSSWVNGYMNIQHLADVDSVDTLQNGDILKYNAPQGLFEFRNLESEVQGDVDDHLNVTSATSGQVLTWNGSDYAWTNKTVDTTDPNTDAQTLSIVGNVITISGSSSTVDLTTALASGGSGGSGGIELTDLTGGTGIDYNDTTGNISLAGSGVSAGTYGSATLVPRITVDATGRVTQVSTQAVSGGGGGGGGGGATVERFKLNYTASGQLSTTSDLTGGIASASIDSAAGGDMTITFTGYNFPPGQILIYGYVHSSNKYTITPFESTIGLREIAGGGTSGNPTLFNGATSPSIKLRLREAETGASRGFGSTTHAWIQFVMYD